MESQVEAMIPHLKMGSKYLFAHKRKGPFVAEYAGTRATDPSDAVDAIFLELHIYTEEGSGQERLARSFIRNEAGQKMHPPFTTTFIRPSLLTSITAPSVQVQQDLLQQFTTIRRKAEEAAKERGGDVLLPALSIPTAQALQQLAAAPPPTPKRRSLLDWYKKLVGSA